jgi:signal transduction histidine kinase
VPTQVVWPTQASGLEGRRFPRVVAGLVWLRAHRDLVLALTVAGIALSFTLDLLIPGYAIAGFYLIPVMLVAFALRERAVIAAVSAASLILAVTAMVVQHRVGGQNVLLIWFGALAGAGLIALGYLYNRFDLLYETERSTTLRLQALTAQLQRLQELSVLGSDRPLSELLHEVVIQASGLLGSNGGALYRLDAGRGVLDCLATSDPSSAEEWLQQVGVARPDANADPGDDAGLLARVLRDRRPVAAATTQGERLAVPLAVREDPYGALLLSYSGVRDFNDEDLHLAAAFADQAALAIENTRLRELIERTAAAAERSRLARDLHDSVTQSLFAASLKAEALHRRWRPESPPALEALDDVRRLTRGALAEMRTLLLEMRPAALAQVPLPDLLRHLVDSSKTRTRTPISQRLDDVGTQPAEVVVAMYRIAQEAMNNVVRHADAPQAWLTLAGHDATLELEVGDDGCGFDEHRVQAHQLGLRIMRERADAADLTLTIDSSPGAGTVVKATWRRGGEP